MTPQTAAVRLLAGAKEPVRVATTANITLSGLQTIDGVTTVAGDRVLVKDQTDATTNGIYTASEGAWKRAPDANSDRLIRKGMMVFVAEGSTQASNVWRASVDHPDIGADDVTFSLYLSTDIISTAAASATAAASSATAAAASAQDAVDAINGASLNNLTSDSLIQNNTSDSNNDIDVLLDGTLVVTKRLDAAWAKGSGVGGLSTGAKANSTTYHLYMISQDSTGDLDAMFDPSATSLTLPSGWSFVRTLGAVTTDASGNIRQFVQWGDYFELLVPELEANGSSNGSVATARTLTGMPHGVKMVARLFIQGSSADLAGGYVNCWDADLGVSVTTTAGKYAAVARAPGLQLAGADITCMTSASGQVNTSDTGSGTTPTLLLHTKGWFDPRVRRHAI